jgi:DNA-binding NarL/FixJ family response regulator
MRGKAEGESSGGFQIQDFRLQNGKTKCRPKGGATLSTQSVDTTLAKGKSPAQVARELGITPRTLRNHLHHANHKLHTRNRLEAVMQAARRRLI